MTDSRLFHFKSWDLLIITLILGLFTSVLAAQDTPQPPPDPKPDNGPARHKTGLRIEEEIGQTRTEQTQIEGAVVATDEDVSVLTRGPLHESFATVYVADPLPGIKIEKQPPESIEEQPPSYKPDGRNVVWIPGYWEWDDEDSDFIWISGIWRDVPPKQQWVPGYWQRFENGYRRVSGFWTSEELEEIVYLPEPPKAVESGPSAPAPGPEYMYIPGAWEYADGQYVWRAGYWSPARENWVWIPDQYIWTPRGVVFVPGYWDYELQYRGVVFAPVRFTTPVYTNPAYVYTPQYAIDSDLNLLVHLFYRPDRYQYYFGDYYDTQYRNTYRSWVTARSTRTFYDPLYTYYSVAFPNRNVNLIDWVDQRHTYFVQNENLRPPRTLQDQISFYRTAQAANVGADIIRLATFGTSVADLSQARDDSFRFSELSDDQMQTFRESRRPFQSLAQGRAELESQARDLANDVRDRITDNRAENRSNQRPGQGNRPDTADRTTTSRPGEGQVRERLNQGANEARLRLRDYRENLRQDAQDLRDRAGQELNNAADRAADEIRRRTNVPGQNQQGNQGNPPRTGGQVQGGARLTGEHLRGNPSSGATPAQDPTGSTHLERNAEAVRQQMNEALRQRPNRPNDWPTMRQPRNFSEGLNLPNVPRFDGGSNQNNTNVPVPGLNQGVPGLNQGNGGGSRRR